MSKGLIDTHYIGKLSSHIPGANYSMRADGIEYFSITVCGGLHKLIPADLNRCQIKHLDIIRAYLEIDWRKFEKEKKLGKIELIIKHLNP
jgi:hypothetical protein